MENLQIGLLKLLPTPLFYLLIAYLGFKIIDFFTGILKTWINNGIYKSKKMRKGLLLWVAELVAIVFIIVLDLLLGLQFYITGLVLALFVYKEAGSILENLAECGVDLPETIKDKLEVLNKKDGE